MITVTTTSRKITGVSIPWRLKLFAKIILSRLPFGYSIWQKIGFFRHGTMDNSQYAINVFNEHVERAGLKGKLAGKTIVEIGPGDSISTAIIASANEAKAILIDAGHFIQNDISSYKDLIAALQNKGLQPPDISSCKSNEEILQLCSASYFTQGLQSLQTLEDNSVDFIFSQAVLEHVKKAEFASTMINCRRILKAGGIFSNQVDLRDHLGGALNNLRFSEPLWESGLFSKSGFYTNRIRYTEMENLFKEAGFEVISTHLTKWDKLPTPKQRLAKEFQDVSDDDLSIQYFNVVLQ